MGGPRAGGGAPRCTQAQTTLVCLGASRLFFAIKAVFFRVRHAVCMLPPRFMSMMVYSMNICSLSAKILPFENDVVQFMGYEI